MRSKSTPIFCLLLCFLQIRLFKIFIFAVLLRQHGAFPHQARRGATVTLTGYSFCTEWPLGSNASIGHGYRMLKAVIYFVAGVRRGRPPLHVYTDNTP